MGADVEIESVIGGSSIGAKAVLLKVSRMDRDSIKLLMRCVARFWCLFEFKVVWTRFGCVETPARAKSHDVG